MEVRRRVWCKRLESIFRIYWNGYIPRIRKENTLKVWSTNLLAGNQLSIRFICNPDFVLLVKQLIEAGKIGFCICIRNNFWKLIVSTVLVNCCHKNVIFINLKSFYLIYWDVQPTKFLNHTFDPLFDWWIAGYVVSENTRL